MANISDIVDVQISIESAGTEPSSFSKMLLLADEPSGTGTVTMPDIAEVSNVDALISYGYTDSSDLYKAMVIAFAQSPKPESIFVAQRKVVSSEVEPIATTLARALSHGGWYGFAIAQQTPATADLTACATWAETNEKLFCFAWTTGTIPVTITNYMRTFAIYGGSADLVEGVTNTGNYFINVAWMAKCFGYDYGSETWAFKTLNGVNPSHLSSSDITGFATAGANYYTDYAGRDITYSGKTGKGEWIDVIRFRDWLIAYIGEKITSFFALNTKVAFTDAGITGVYNVLDSCLKYGQTLGGIRGSEFDGDGIESKGYTITVPLASSISSATKATRRLTGVSFVANLAGAIHFAQINGKLVY